MSGITVELSKICEKSSRMCGQSKYKTQRQECIADSQECIADSQDARCSILDQGFNTQLSSSFGISQSSASCTLQGSNIKQAIHHNITQNTNTNINLNKKFLHTAISNLLHHTTMVKKRSSTTLQHTYVFLFYFFLMQARAQGYAPSYISSLDSYDPSYDRFSKDVRKTDDSDEYSDSSIDKFFDFAKKSKYDDDEKEQEKEYNEDDLYDKDKKGDKSIAMLSNFDRERMNIYSKDKKEESKSGPKKHEAYTPTNGIPSENVKRMMFSIRSPLSRPFDVSGGPIMPMFAFHDSEEPYEASDTNPKFSNDHVINDTVSYNNSSSNMNGSGTNEYKDYDMQPIRSITQGKINTSSKNLNKVLHKELGDVSADLSKKVEQAIKNVSRQTPQNYKEIIIIKKRILSDGKRKVVNLNVREKLVPKKNIEEEENDFGTRALIGGVLFLIAGLIFTTTLKMYQTYVKEKYMKKTETTKTSM